MSSESTADVIICTYTEARWDLLVQSVTSVLKQRVPPGRLIVVVDHNDELLARCQARWGSGSSTSSVPIAVSANRFAGRLGSARNTGLLLASAEVVAFLDDDAAADVDWLERLLAVYDSHPEAVAVGGAPRPVYEIPRPEWFPPDFDWIFGCHYDMLPSVLAPLRHLIGANMSVRRKEMLAIGGFRADDHDDMDLSHRVADAHGAASVLYEPRAQVRHYVSAERLTWTYFWRRCYFVNRGKVSAFADMGPAGNIGAEARFVGRLVLKGGPAVLAASSGRAQPLRQWLVALVGTAIASAGYLSGRVRLARGIKFECPTTGLTAYDLDQATHLAAAGDA
ncbi:glycosyltransferase family 2 protein [Mycobacterium yunnanensis]|uniref:Glycosyltransferase family 2 protein n=1 Tax=Mycobacterium yunnanensis TaxID=368477 RepID=A0A9X2YW63_9MYCO|nr:glycosyltransferase [Mycobacterium yunnanensis]MCV7418951.1 glycosyltransferase family 2 protein [Mycobacterium yunnanensis]